MTPGRRYDDPDPTRRRLGCVGSLPGAESAALAGGGALIVHGIVEHRYRQDFPVSDEYYERLRAWVHSWRSELPAPEAEPPYRESQ